MSPRGSRGSESTPFDSSELRVRCSFATPEINNTGGSVTITDGHFTNPGSRVIVGSDPRDFKDIPKFTEKFGEFPNYKSPDDSALSFAVDLNFPDVLIYAECFQQINDIDERFNLSLHATIVVVGDEGAHHEYTHWNVIVDHEDCQNPHHLFGRLQTLAGKFQEDGSVWFYNEKEDTSDNGPLEPRGHTDMVTYLNKANSAKVAEILHRGDGHVLNMVTAGLIESFRDVYGTVDSETSETTTSGSSSTVSFGEAWYSRFNNEEE